MVLTINSPKPVPFLTFRIIMKRIWSYNNNKYLEEYVFNVNTEKLNFS